MIQASLPAGGSVDHAIDLLPDVVDVDVNVCLLGQVATL